MTNVPQTTSVERLAQHVLRLTNRLARERVPFMSDPSSDPISDRPPACVTTLASWLRECMTERTTLAILASSAIAATMAITWPSREYLSAGQFASGDDQAIAGFQNVAGGDSNGMQIVPRGKDVSRQPIQDWRESRTASFNKPASGQQHSAGRRATLQAPIFSTAQVTNTPAVPEQAISNEPARIGHSGMGQRSVGMNYVDATGIHSLPYGGTSATKSTSAMEHRVLGNVSTSNPMRSGRSRQESELLIPSTPVPAVPVPEAPPTVAKPQTEIPNAFYPEMTTPSMQDGHQEIQTPPMDRSGSVVPQQNSQPSRGTADIPLSSQGIPAGPRSIQGTPARPRNPGHGAVPGTSGFRATVESDAPGWIGPYMGRTDMIPDGSENLLTPAPSVIMPPDFTAWWDSAVQQRAGIAPRSLPIDVTSLVEQALIHSPQVQVLQADPEVQQRIVRQEEAAFDWRAFLDTKYDDLSDPIGNTLTTGNNSSRFQDNKFNASGGVKRRTGSGGELKVAQQFGHQYNNSRFLLPNAQATSRLELSFRQPLLNGAGTVYSQNQIVLARIASNSTGDETLQELQAHLFSVAEVYWKLYKARAEFFQRQKLLSSAQRVLTTLEARNQVDTIPRQTLRARAAVARAESRMQRAVTDIRNAESQLRLLVNDPEMLNSGPTEFTPTETPAMMESSIGLRDSLQTALINRPDISLAIRQMRASGVRMGVSKSEMLPKLDFIVSSYVAGLQNSTQFADSYGDQFSQGRPGYTVGLEFEVPLGNRAAKAKMEQRQWELKRAINGFRATVETSLTEVEIANREVETSYRELLGKYQAMFAAQNEVSYLQDRFEVLPMAEESSMLLLEDLLDGFERLADEESAFAQAQTNYALSIIQLRRSTGTLMRSRHDAPELKADESDWMSSRAEQTVDESISTVAKTANLTTAETLDSAERPPAEWSQPIKSQAVDKTPQMVAPAPRPKSAVQQVGGHSFNRER